MGSNSPRGRYDFEDIPRLNALLSHSLLIPSTLLVDDHPQYLLTDGTRDLTGDWTISSNSIALTAGNLDVGGQISVGDFANNPRNTFPVNVYASDGGYEAIRVNEVDAVRGSFLTLIRTRGTTASPTTVLTGDELGKVVFGGLTLGNVNFAFGGQISCVAGTIDDNRIDGELVFSTWENEVMADWMKIEPAGQVRIINSLKIGDDSNPGVEFDLLGNSLITLTGTGVERFKIDGNTTKIAVTGGTDIGYLLTNTFDGAFTSSPIVVGYSFQNTSEVTYTGNPLARTNVRGTQITSGWSGDFDNTGTKGIAIPTHEGLILLAEVTAGTTIKNSVAGGTAVFTNTGAMIDSVFNGTIDETDGTLTLNVKGGEFTARSSSVPVLVGTPEINYIAGDLISTIPSAFSSLGTAIGMRSAASGGDTNIGNQILAISTAGTANTGLEIGAITGATTNRAIASAGGDSHHVGSFTFGATSAPTHTVTIVGDLLVGTATILGTATGNIAIGNTFTLESLTTGDNNLATGDNTGREITEASDNCLYGRLAGGNITTSPGNVGVGFESLLTLTTGDGFNVAVGKNSMRGGAGTAAFNTAVGGSSLHSITSADGVTAVGYFAGFATSSNDGGIFLGHFAGRYQFATDRLVIDNRDRGSAAAEATDAILFGTMAATPAGQSLAVNATLTIGTSTAAAFVIGNGAAGVDYIVTVDGETNDGTYTWMEDEDHWRFNDDVALDNGEFLVMDKASGNGIKIDTSSGNATFGFADIIGDQFSRNTGATKPTLATYNGVVRAWQFGNGDEANISYHIPHDYVLGTDIHLHIHWSQTSATNTGGDIDFRYTAIYAKGHNQASGSTFTATPKTALFTSIALAGAGSNQFQHHLTEITISAATATAALFDSDDFEPDGVIELTFEMDANNLTDSVTVLDPFIHFVDIHYQSNSIIGTKSRTPDFYA